MTLNIKGADFDGTDFDNQTSDVVTANTLGMKIPLTKLSPIIASNDFLWEVANGRMEIGESPQSSKSVDIVQSFLRFAGYPIAGLSEKNRGIFDPKTAEALRSFQKNYGLASTGVLDQPTLMTLDAACQNKAEKEGVTFGKQGNMITYVNDNPDNPSPYQPISSDCAKIIVDGLLETDLMNININSTTGGKHSPNSNHYKARAVDINEINEKPVSEPSNKENVEMLQKAFDKQENINENFGPALKHKKGKPAKVSGHGDHIHISCYPKV